MESQSQDAQRTEGSAESRFSMEVSQTPHEPTPTPVFGTPGYESRSRSKDIKELRQLGAVDFHGTTDPAEAETWLKRTERIFWLMRCTVEDRLDMAASLLQGNAYDW